MLELAPEGFEEVDRRDGVELAAYTDAGGEERLWHFFGGARSRRRRGGLGGPLARVPPAGPDRAALDRAAVGGAAGGRARGRHRSGPRVRHRRASDDAALPRAAARSWSAARCSTSAAARACSRSRRRCSASGRCSASTSSEPSIEATLRERRAQRRRASRRALVDGRRGAAARGDSPSRTSRSPRWSELAAAARRRRGSSRPATSSSEQPRLAGLRARRPARARRLGRRPVRTRVSAYDSARGDVPRRLSRAARSRTPTRTRSASGCSRDGHARASPSGGRRRRDQHLLRHERGGREEPQGGRAGRADARAASTSPAAPRTSTATLRRAAAERHRRRAARARRRPRSSPATSARSAASRPTRALDRVRAFVKIQDGCSFSCDFCVIPLVRGGSRSRSADAVLGEIRRRVDQGHREVVLTGINLGCFRDRAAGYDLPRLVREAGATPGLERLRLSLDRDQPRRRRRSSPRCARRRPCRRHLHVPLQSGDDGVLRAMRRRYTVGHVPAPARAARRRVQPDERRDRRLPGRGRRSVRAHARARSSAPGSPRCTSSRTRRGPARDTAADDPVPPPVKKERGARLRALSARALPRRWQREGRHARRRARRPARPRLRRRLLAVARRRARRRARARPRGGVTRGGDPCRRSVTTASSAARPRGRPRRTRRRASSRSATSTRRRPCTCSCIPERHVDTFRDVGELRRRRGEADARVRRRDRARASGSRTTGCIVNVGAERRADGLPPALARPRRQPSRRGADDGVTRAMSLIARARGGGEGRDAARATTSAATRCA